MHAPSAGELLSAWEQALSAPASMRAIWLLARFCPESNVDALAKLPIGQRDRQLLDLRTQAFGNRTACIANCQNCGETLDVELDLKSIRQLEETTARTSVDLAHDGWQICLRLPNTLDLAAAASASDPLEAKHLLLVRCIESAVNPQAAAVTARDLPDQIIEAISHRMSQADPQADVQLALTCPQCGHQSNAIFDITLFFWEELQAFTKRLMREVHELARAYGWREIDILNMSAPRRAAYLEMLGA